MEVVARRLHRSWASPLPTILRSGGQRKDSCLDCFSLNAQPALGTSCLRAGRSVRLRPFPVSGVRKRAVLGRLTLVACSAPGGQEAGEQPGSLSHASESNSEAPLLPPVVNWHLEERCNYACKFCFATFRDNEGLEVTKEAQKLLSLPAALKAHGATRLNFAGGEPFLHPLIEELLEASKKAGLVTSVVTNGSCLDEELLTGLRPVLDWIAFSVDASSDDIHARIGRGRKGDLAKGSCSHLEHVLAMWSVARRLGYGLKLNTVVCRENLLDDMAPLVLQLRPERWKVFQVLPVDGQNDGSVEYLLISPEEFADWVRRHREDVEPHGVKLVPEANSNMVGTYAMLDARGRFFTNTLGFHKYGTSAYDVGVAEAWVSVSDTFDGLGYVGRKGLWDYGQSASAKDVEKLWFQGLN